ncbi:hypothetical protein F5888DRAFT_1801299 [Russula emetica]|nr:hypothetical protein F5888DRAFT_1801299 [Russula emetica]
MPFSRLSVYTASLENAAIIAASLFFDLLEDSTAEKLMALALEYSTYLQEHLRAFLAASSVPAQSSPRQSTSDISDDVS